MFGDSRRRPADKFDRFARLQFERKTWKFTTFSRIVRNDRVHKNKNRAKRSGDDREARGIFEFGTTVGLRRFPARVCTQPKPKSCGHSKNNFISMPEIQKAYAINKAPLLMRVKEKNKLLVLLHEKIRPGSGINRLIPRSLSMDWTPRQISFTILHWRDRLQAD
jgi:hypothetical protein